MKRAEINKQIRLKILSYFEGYSRQEVTAFDISKFMAEINKWFQEIAHDLVDNTGLMAHMDRHAIKDASRLYTLQQLGIHYSPSVIEYIWILHKSKNQEPLTEKDMEKEQ